MTRGSRRGTLLAAAALLAALIAGTLSQGAPSANGKAKTKERAVTKTSGAAHQKLHPKLEKKVESGSTDDIFVYVTVSGDPSAVKDLLSDEKVAAVQRRRHRCRQDRRPDAAEAGERRRASSPSARSSSSKTGEPLGIGDPDLGAPAKKNDHKKLFKDLHGKEVPYSKAPAPHGSNFEALKNVAALDAKTHRFADAWAAGYTGQGVTVGRARRRHRLRPSGPPRTPGRSGRA